MSDAPLPEPKASLLSLWLRDVDDVLRGRWTQPAELQARGVSSVPVRGLLEKGLVLGSVYGLCLGAFGVFHGGDGAWLQAFSSAIKLPLLFLLTLVVTFPSLYVFAALLHLPIGRLATLRLLLVAVVVHLAVLASLGPVFAFFAASTRSYDFLLLLNVAFASLGGLISLAMLRRATGALLGGGAPEPRVEPAAAQSAAPEGPPPSPPQRTGPAAPVTDRRASRRLLAVWCLLYGLVGAQMGWLLRPFLGAPGDPFVFLRGTDSSFFEAVWQSLVRFLSAS